MTTTFEQTILAAHIYRFFAAPEHSAERARTVRDVLALLSVERRKWTGRLVRVWFSNNRRRLWDVRAVPPQLPYPQPMPPQFQFGYVPIVPIMTQQKDDQTPPANSECRSQPDVQYFPLLPFRPPGS
jgi:hypothetical protein